jgi:hypothetical protein
MDVAVGKMKLGKIYSLGFITLPLLVITAAGLGVSQAAAAPTGKTVQTASSHARLAAIVKKTDKIARTRSTGQHPSVTVKKVTATKPNVAPSSATVPPPSPATSAAPVTQTASRPSLSPLALSETKLISYMPADAAWTNMWTDYQPATISADFARISSLGANTVRLVIDPTVFGFPAPSATMRQELAETVAAAQAQGLRVQLTLFDWWHNYADISDSVAWVGSLLEPFKDDAEVTFVEVQNEIDPTDPAAMGWARALIPAVEQVVGTVPVTISTSGAQGVAGLTELKQQLEGDQPDFYDFHYYGVGGAAASVLAEAKVAAYPKALFVGETGISTYSQTPGDQAAAESAQATFFANVEAASQSDGLPPAAVWTLSDLDPSGVPAGAGDDPTQLYYGLYDINGEPKPAAEVIRSFFTTGELPLLSNGGFEVGAGGVPTAWTPSGPSTGTLAWDQSVSHSGSASVSISDSGSQASWTQSASTGVVTAGQRLQATVWAEGTGVTGYNVLAVSWFDADNDYLGNDVSSPLPLGQSNWTELGVDASAPAGAAFAVIYLQSSNDSGTVWFDDASLVDVGSGSFPTLPEVPVTSGVGPTLANSGFELGGSGGGGGGPASWTPSGPSTGTLAWDQSVAHSGSASVSISASGSQASWTQIINTGALSPGEAILASVWAQGSDVSGYNVMAVSWFDADNNWLGNNVTAPIPAGNSGWSQLSVDATAPAGAAYAVLYLQSSNDTGTVHFDDVNVAVG